MTRLRHPSTRAAWRWCLVYTAPVPEDRRERRRDEVLSHLWEGEQEHLQPRAVLAATARGALHDVTWAARLGGRDVLAAPGTWLTTAVAFTVVALGVSTFAGSSTAGTAEGIGLIGSLAMLVVSGLLWWRRRR